MEQYITEIDAALRRVRRHRRIRRYWTPILLSCIACFLLFHFVVGLSVVSGASMNPSLYSGDLVVFLRVGPPPEVGDMVIITGRGDIDTVKRVTATAGDTLEVDRNGHLQRNGQPVYEEEVWYGQQDTRDWLPFPYTVPQGYYFSMGDNRALSLDSRNKAIGPVPSAQIAGRVILSLRLQRPMAGS